MDVDHRRAVFVFCRGGSSEGALSLGVGQVVATALMRV